MKVMIVGAGGQGGACASILSRQDAIEEIKLFDLDKKIADFVADHIANPKIITGALDATNSDDVSKAAKNVDVVIDMVMPWMATYVMEGALKAGANYINSAFDVPFWDKLSAGAQVEDLPLYKEFKEAGLTALLGCGFAPGWTNVLTRRLANRLDEVDSIKLRIGKATIFPDEKPYDWVFRPWNPGWSPKQALIDCSDSTYAYEQGKFVKYPPFGGLEMYDFPEPVGKLPITHHSHEEVYSMPATFKGVKNIDFKYYLMMQPAIFYATGLCSREEIEVNGVKVKPIDVVASIIPKPNNNIFIDSDEKLDADDKIKFIETVIEVSGSKNGVKTTWKAICPNMNAPGRKLKELYGTSLVYVALPMSVGAMLMESNLDKGIIFADQLDPEMFLGKIMSTGYPYKWEEVKM